MNPKILEALQFFKNRLSTVLSQATSIFQKVFARFQKLSVREKRILAATAVILFLWVLDEGIVQPFRRNFAKLENDIHTQKKNAEWIYRTISQKPSVNAAYESLKQALNVEDKNPESVRASFLKDVEQLARDKDVSLGEVRPQISSDRKNYTEYSVRIQADARMENLIQFLAEMIRTKKLYCIKTIRVAPHPEDVNKVRANILLLRVVFSDL